MPRRERDPRPPIEVFGGAPSAESVREIAVGGGSGGGRRWQLVIVAVALLIGGVALTKSGDDDGTPAATSTSTSTTVRRSTTTSTSTTFVPGGPVLPVQTGASLLFVSSSRRWTVLDLDTGDRREVEGGAGDVFGGLVPVRGGVVTTDGTRAEYRPVLTDGAVVPLGRAFSILGSGDPERVWLVQTDPLGIPTRAVLVDLAGRVKAQRSVGNGYLTGATVEGPIVSDGGRTYVIGADGLRYLGVGNVYGAPAGGRVIIDSCSEEGRCGPQVVDVRTGERREIPALQATAGRNGSESFDLSDDGQVVATSFGERGVSLRWVDASGRLIGQGDVFVDMEQLGAFNGPPDFLPDGQGLVWSGGNGNVARVTPNDGGLLVERLPDPGTRQVDRVVVIRP